MLTFDLSRTTQFGVEVTANENSWTVYVPGFGEKSGRIEGLKILGMGKAITEFGAAVSRDGANEDYSRGSKRTLAGLNLDLLRLYAHMKDIVPYNSIPDAPASVTASDLLIGAVILSARIAEGMN